MLGSRRGLEAVVLGLLALVLLGDLPVLHDHAAPGV
jgi:hypothetical protein